MNHHPAWTWIPAALLIAAAALATLATTALLAVVTLTTWPAVPWAALALVLLGVAARSYDQWDRTR